VETIVCPELVHAVENNQTDLTTLHLLFEHTLAPALARGADQIVLGCTHFPFAMEAIRAYAGPDVRVIDPSPAIAQQTRRILAQSGLLGDSDAPLSPPRYFTTGDATRFSILAESLLGEPVAATRLSWAGGNLRLPENPPTNT